MQLSLYFMNTLIKLISWRRVIASLQSRRGPAKAVALFTLVCFFVTNSNVSFVYAQLASPSRGEFRLPAPGVMIHLSPEFNPLILKGIKVHPDNPFRFDFILERGDSQLSNDALKDESGKLIKYFLASLTIPEKDLWVNLSPYEKDRIIPQSFGITEMGRDLLAEDYMLKQITASLIYPEEEMGKRFWKRVYEEAAKKFGTTNVPVNTFNKVWIVPEKAVVYENAKAGTAYVVESKLKVMLEEDYLAFEKNQRQSGAPTRGHVPEGDVSSSTLPSELGLNVKAAQGNHFTPSKNVNALGSQIIREIVIPELTKEINGGKNFAQLRQVYNSLILAIWYKNKIKDSILSQVYADKNKTAGVNIDDPQEKQKIYERYLQAFKKGVYNYIKEDKIPYSFGANPGGQTIARKYFSGGMLIVPRLDYAMVTDVRVSQAIHHAGPSLIVQAGLAVPKEASFDFSRWQNKRLLVLDDNKEISAAHKRLLADYFPDGNIFTGASPQEGLAQIQVWLKEGINSSDIVVITDFQFEEGTTAIDLINPLRVPGKGRSVFEGPILIVSGSLISKTQIPGFSDGQLDDNIRQAYGIDYLEKNGALDFREQFLGKLHQVLEHAVDPTGFSHEPMTAQINPKVYIPGQVAYFEGGINDLETLLGQKLQSLHEVILKHTRKGDHTTVDRDIREFITRIQSIATFGNTPRELSMEDRTHAYRNNINELAISESLRHLQDYLESLSLNQQADIKNEFDDVHAMLERMQSYANFLNQLFFYMRGLDKLNAFQPLLQSAVGQYQHDFEGKETPEFDPNRGIAMALDQLSQANRQMQQGIIQDSMLEWGRIYGQYKTIKSSFDQVLGKKAADTRIMAFMDRFSQQLNNFFGQYLQRFGHTNLIGAEGGAAAGRLVVVQGTEEHVLAQLETLTPEDIVIMDQDYTNLTIASTKARGFIFGREGAGHIVTRARTLQVPLVILPNAIEYFRQFQGKDEWVFIDSRDGQGALRFISPQERDIAPALQRQPIVAQPVERDLTGPLMLSNTDSFFDLSIDEMAKKMGYKAANLYANFRDANVRIPTTVTLLNRFFEALMADNPEISRRLREEFNQIDKNDPTALIEHLKSMQEMIKHLVISQQKKQNIWYELGYRMKTTPYLILRLSTGAEDLENFPGVGAGVYGSLELVPWAVEKGDGDYEVPEQNKENLINKMLEAYASFWSFNAYADRERYGIDHWAVGSALPIQEYMHQAKYSVQVHTADPSRRDRNIIKIEIVPGAGRGLTAPDAELQGRALTFYYDKTLGKVIDRDDPRTGYHPVMLGKTHMVSLTTGEIEEINKALYPELKDFHKLAKVIIPEVLKIEQLHQRAQDIEGVVLIPESGAFFVDVQSRAQANIMPYETGYGQSIRIRQEYQGMAKRFNEWLDKYGRKNFQSLDFYKGSEFEAPALQEFFPTDHGYYGEASKLIPNLLGALNLHAEHQDITLLYQFLMSSEEFADVREGVLRRLFFYAQWQHTYISQYFKELSDKQPDLFLKIIHYAIVPIEQGDVFDGWFRRINAWSLLRVFTDNLILEQATNGLPTEDVISIINQFYRYEKSGDKAIDKLSPYESETYLYGPLFSRPDYEKIMSGLLPEAAQQARVAFKKANPNAVLPQESPTAVVATPVESTPPAPVTPKILSPYEQQKAKFNAWLEQNGRKNFQSLEFYKGENFEAPALRKFFPTGWGNYGKKSNLIEELFRLLNLGFDPENLTQLYNFLISSEDFVDVREGILRRVFFYVQFQHADISQYFRDLCKNEPDTFLKILPYAIVPMAKDDEFNAGWFGRVNAWSLVRTFQVAFAVRKAMAELPAKDVISIIGQIYRWGENKGSYKGFLTPEEVKRIFFPILFKRSDYQQILAGVLPGAAEELRAAFEAANPPAPKPLSPYEKEKANFRESIAAFVQEVGADKIQQVHFYISNTQEPLLFYMFDHRKSDGLQFTDFLVPKGTFLNLEEKLHYAVDVLVNDESLAQVREGLLKRLFFYCTGAHEIYIKFLLGLYQENRPMFDQILKYIVPEFTQQTDDMHFALNQYLVTRLINAGDKEFIRHMTAQVSNEDIVHIFNMHENARSKRLYISALKSEYLEAMIEVLKSQDRYQTVLNLLTPAVQERIKRVDSFGKSPVAVSKPATEVQPLSPYEKNKAKFRESITAFIKEAGGDSIQQLNFERGNGQEAISIIRALAHAENKREQFVFLLMPKEFNNLNEALHYVVDVLMDDEAFAKTRAGLLKRIFYYCLNAHEVFMEYLLELYRDNRPRFNQVIKYFVPRYTEKTTSYDFLDNNYLPTRVMNRGGVEFIKDMISQLNDEDTVYLLNMDADARRNNENWFGQPFFIDEDGLKAIVGVLRQQGRLESILGTLKGPTRDDFQKVVDEAMLSKKAGDLAMRGPLSSMIQEIPLTGGANLLTPLGPQDLSKIMAENLKYYVRSNQGVSQLEPVATQWDTNNAPLAHLDRELKLMDKIRTIYKQRVGQEVILLDWGGGTGRGSVELHNELQSEGIPHHIYVLSHDYSPDWQNAPKGVTFILDDAVNLPEYLGSDTVDIIFSSTGINHFLKDTGYRIQSPDKKGHLDDLKRILKPGGVLRMTGYFPGEWEILKRNGGVVALWGMEFRLAPGVNRWYSFEFQKNPVMVTRGGIDLSPARMHLQTKNDGSIIFHLDPAMLQQLQNAPGFVPVIINIQPLKNLPEFLGMTSEVSTDKLAP